MKTYLLLLVLLITVKTYSQTIEPKPHRFNWGTYTAPFHDTSHSITKTFVGWEWGGGDSAFDKFMF